MWLRMPGACGSPSRVSLNRAWCPQGHGGETSWGLPGEGAAGQAEGPCIPVPRSGRCHRSLSFKTSSSSWRKITVSFPFIFITGTLAIHRIKLIIRRKQGGGSKPSFSLHLSTAVFLWLSEKQPCLVLFMEVTGSQRPFWSYGLGWARRGCV